MIVGFICFIALNPNDAKSTMHNFLHICKSYCPSETLYVNTDHAQAMVPTQNVNKQFVQAKISNEHFFLAINTVYRSINGDYRAINTVYRR